MKQPKLIYTYAESINAHCKVKEYFLRVYLPSKYNSQPKYFFQFADQLFSIRAQSNTETDPTLEYWNGKGFHHAYAIRIEDLELGRPEAFTLAAKLCKDLGKQDSLPEIIKRLKKLGAVRYAIGDVETRPGSFGREFMPRRYARSKSFAYWNAINAGLELTV